MTRAIGLLSLSMLLIGLSGCSYLFYPRAGDYATQAKGASGVETMINLANMMEATAAKAKGGKGVDTAFDDLHNQFHALSDAFCGVTDAQAKTPAEADLIRDNARTFFYSRTNGEQPRCFRMRFAKVAYLMQMPTVDVEREAEREKGAPLTDADRVELRQRMNDARRWLQTYAPDQYRFQVQSRLPDVPLDDAQRVFLGRLAEMIRGRPAWSGEELHEQIHALKNQLGLPPKQAFSAIYLAFLGKPSGPQAGWFLAALDRDFVLTRLGEAATGVRGQGSGVR